MKIRLEQRQRIFRTFRFRVIAYSLTIAVLSFVITIITTTEQSATANTFDSTGTLENSTFANHDSTSQLLMIEKRAK
ncbi:MAG: hypothetical protein IPP27_05135 [Bacteroidetes bacterium]|nr:hypothetical protein [Bacteroidota bacterium]MBK9415141.1 hypothetical protein [Bacteroidota bacterium]MBL0031582.1 hypothetical protein [Bacteroidota bacterium]MBP6427364.1 hypothetical protein [Bacteroidia bacterium]MBP6657975.1 hypothetical protein [Bacteroidia bacterium]